MFDPHLGSGRKVCADVGRWERLCEFAVVSSAFQGALWNAFHRPKWPIANLYASECVCVFMIVEWFCAMEMCDVVYMKTFDTTPEKYLLKCCIACHWCCKKYFMNRIYVRTVHWSLISTSQKSTASRSTKSCMSPTMSSLLHHQKVQPALWSSLMSIRRVRNTFGEYKRWWITMFATMVHLILCLSYLSSMANR